MNIKVDFDNIVVKEDKIDFNVKVLMLKGEKGDQGDGESNVIEKVQVNGTDLTVTNKTVNVPVPTVDSALSSSSTNPVQNKVIYEALGNKVDTSELDNYYEISQVDAFVSEINKKTYYFDSVQGMKSYNLEEGDYVITKGYHTANDGGGANYKIVDDNTLVDDGGSIHDLTNGLKARLIVDKNTNAKTFGAYGDNTHDDSTSINTMLNSLGYIYLKNGTYKVSGTITLHSNQYIYGEDKNNSIINYVGSSYCITNEDVSTSKNISIHDLTLTGTNRTGKGIYLIRTTKQSDTCHRLYNLHVKSFEYGIHLEAALNEIQLSDIICGGNDYGIYVHSLNDFYMERIVCCVNNKHGLYLSNTTEGRISDCKFWYNGSSDANTYYNLCLTSCLAIMINNISCQESYGSNMLLSYSKNLSITNCYLSLPCLDGNEHFQISMDQLQESNVEVYCANKKVEGSYINKILRASNKNQRNNMCIHVEDDFPEANLLSQISSNNGYGFNLINNISLNNKLLNINNAVNYIINGNLANTSDISSFVTAGIDYCSINSGKLRIANSTGSTISVTFKHPALPRTGLYTFYVLFKKVSGTGRVVTQYSGYKDVSNDTSTSEELYASYCTNKTSSSSATNMLLQVPAGLTIDVIEVGLCQGSTCNTRNPLYYKSIL